MNVQLHVYLLRFRDPGRFQHAFQLVTEAPGVVNCTLDAPQKQVRLLTPRRAGDALVERIYQDGGLVWCSRHELLPSAHAADPRGDAGIRARADYRRSGSRIGS